MKSILSAKTIERLRAIFATHELPQKIVSDNGPLFTSDKFKKFMQANNGIRHITLAPYHPSTNGLAERAVQTVKNGLRQMKGEAVEEKLSRFLMKYKNHSSFNHRISPSQLLMGHRLRTRLTYFIRTWQTVWRVVSGNRCKATTTPSVQGRRSSLC